jgi:hypothetical protein
MVMKVYGQIVDKDRQQLTGKLEERLYQKETAKTKSAEQDTEQDDIEVNALVKMLSKIKDNDPILQKKLLQALLT